MPPRARRWAGILSSGTSSKRIVPWRAGRMPIAERISVVLPAPLRPIRPANFPVGTSMLTSRRMPTDWMETSSASMRNMLASAGVARLAGHVLAHFGIVENDAGFAVRDEPALVEGQPSMGIAVDDIHVVLDEQHRDLLRAYRLHDHVHQPELLVRRHARGGFVEQQDLRLYRHGHGNVEQLAHTLGQHAGRLVAIAGEIEALQYRVHRLAGVAGMATRIRPLPAAGGHDADADQQVLMHRQCVEQLRDLKRTADAEPRDLARRQRRNVTASEGDAAGTGLQVTGDHVDERGLACAVAADQSHHTVPFDGDVDVGRRGDRAESFVEATCFEYGSHLS